MEFHLDTSSGLSIQRVGERSLVVDERELGASFLLSTTRLVPDWPYARIEELDQAAIESILALDPEIVLIGTGVRQAFVAASIQADFLRRGIGIECMDNRACARTFNLLASEARHVVAGFLLPAAG